MAVINGGLVIPIPFSEERRTYPKYERYLLVQHRSRQFYYLVDRLSMICPDLDELLRHFKEIGNERLVKYVKGRVIGLLLVRYLYFLLYSQRYSHRGALIFYANYFHKKRGGENDNSLPASLNHSINSRL